MCVCVCGGGRGGQGVRSLLVLQYQAKNQDPNLFICGLSCNPTGRAPSFNQIVQAASFSRKTFLIYTPHPFCRSSPSLFTHTPFTFVCIPSFPYVYPIFPMFSLCIFPQCFSNHPLVRLLIPFIVSHQRGNHPYHFTNSHAFLLSPES